MVAENWVNIGSSNGLLLGGNNPLAEPISSWCYQMETFSALLALCAGKSPVIGEFPMTRSFDVFFDLRLNKRLSKHREAGDLRRHRAHYDVIVM